jgi:hypothetical protein
MAQPRTWVTLELVTATIMNAHVRDMFNAIAVAKGALLTIGDFAGAPITTGVRGWFRIPFGIRITAWSLLADVSGSIQLDVWRTTYALFAPGVHPVAADSIAGAEKPTLVAAAKNEDTLLTTWSTDVNAGEVIAVNVDSTGGTIKQASLTLHGTLLALT